MRPVALIIGASSGMGLASARKLAHEGFDLCLIHRDRRAEYERIEKAFNELRQAGAKVWAYNKDAIKEETVEEVLTHLEKDKVKISLLLHSIARGNLKLMASFKERDLSSDYFSKSQELLNKTFSAEDAFLQKNDFTLTVESMAISYYQWVIALHRRDLFTKNAMTLTLTSEGSRKAWHNYAAVSASKAALEAISRSMALELAPHGICSNVIQAGVTDTPALRMIKGSDLIKAQSLFKNPMGRLTQAEDVANVVYLLSKPEARWINGAIIPVDGGESIA